MTTENKAAPTEVEETTLDEISGGPHFRSWHDVSYDQNAIMKVRHDTAKAMIQKVEQA